MPGLNPLDDYLLELERMVAAGFTYDNSGPWRCDGSRHSADCSGFIVQGLNRGAGVPQACTNSYTFAKMCHDAERPSWMVDAYGPGTGTQVTMEQALGIAGAWGIHGNDEGQAPDASGDGHIKVSMGDGRRSIEAMSHRAGVGYSDFDSPPGFINYCALPPMLLDWFKVTPTGSPVPVTEDEDVIVIQCPTKPASPDGLDQPYAVFIPANQMFPQGAAICHNGARLNNDLPVAGNQSIFVPTLRSGGTKWVSMAKKPDILVTDSKGNVTGVTSKGITFIDDQGNTSGVTAGYWA